MKIARINLQFNLENEREKKAYEILNSIRGSSTIKRYVAEAVISHHKHLTEKEETWADLKALKEDVDSLKEEMIRILKAIGMKPTYIKP